MVWDPRRFILGDCGALDWVWSPSGLGLLPSALEIDLGPGPSTWSLPTPRTPASRSYSILKPRSAWGQEQEEGGRIPRCLEWGCFPKPV